MTALDDPSPPGVDLDKRPNVLPFPRPAATVAERDTTIPARRERQLLVAVRRRGAHLVTTLRRDTTWTRAARVSARGAWVCGQGGISWVHRSMLAATHGHLREQIRLARAAGDRVALAEWVERLNEARTDRIDRLVKLPRAVLGVLLAVGVAAGIALALALAVGVVAFLSQGGAGWSSWWSGVGSTIALAVQIGRWAARAAVWLALPVAALLAYREGKRRADPPMWLLAPDERKILGSEITPSKVVVAMRDLGISALKKALTEVQDAGAGMLGPIAVAGPGVEVDALLPSGVSTDLIQGRRRRLAENLDRHEHELHISIPRARTVRLWIADPGALDLPVEPSPLVADPKVRANLHAGRAPLGKNLRDDPVGVSLWQRHVTITGISNHGKTAVLRALALWAAFDVAHEFHIADLKGIGDWGMFAGLATCYISGPADQHVIDAVEMLEAGVEEMNRRLQSGRTDWPHLFLIVDEAQKAYMCPVKDEQGRPYGGKSAKSRFFMAARTLHNQGRVVGVVLWQGTQDPTDENFPKIVREGAHIRMSLVVGTASQAEMALGEAAVNGGASPHLLRQDIDKGVVVMHGGVELPRGETSVTVRTHFIDTQPAWEVAARAVERRRKAGKLVEQAQTGRVPVDHLADIVAAMRGEKRVRTVVVLGRLIEDDPAVYEAWGHDDLAGAVREYAHLGVDIRKYGGDSVLRLEEVSRAMEIRE